MRSADRHPRLHVLAISIVAICTVALAAGCSSKPVKPPPPAPRYATLPPKQVPEFLKDTVLERTDLIETDPMVISGFGVVAHLNNTADNTLIPQSVRSYIIKQMRAHGMGSKLNPDYADMQPEEMLRSPTVAVVRVDGLLPPGARKGDRFDLRISALPGTNTTSLARGALYRTELKVNGAIAEAPGVAVNVPGFGEGPVFINPAYALEGASPQSDQAKASLRYGVVMNGGISMDYRPLVLRLRQPQRSLARGIELLIEQRFASLKQSQTDRIASAKDEGIVYFQMPPDFHGDWEHFAGVVQHLYLETRAGVIAEKARRLTEEAVKPNAQLQDISLCWEAIGTPALEFIEPLLSNPSPLVSFYAAKAGAYIGGDPASIETLIHIIGVKDHPFQIAAIQVLGDLPSSPVIAQALRRLLDADQNLVRIAAYRVLADHDDSRIYSRQISRGIGQSISFTLDIVPSQGPPIIYASRTGPARLAIIGAKPSINLPAMFTALDNQFSISSAAAANTVTIFYRGLDVARPIRVESNPDIAEIAARLGGVSAPGEPALNFSYCDVVAMLQALSDAHQVSSAANGQRVSAAFVMQEVSGAQQDILSAPVIPDQGRPESSGPVGLNDPNNGIRSQ